MSDFVSAPVDPEVVLPSAVRQAAARAEELLRQYNEPLEEGASSEEATPAAGDVTPAGNPPEPAPAAEPAKPRAKRPAEPAAQPVAQPAQPAAQPQADAIDWEHRAKSLEGRVPGLERANVQLTEEVNNLRELIASMHATGAAKPAEEPIKAERLVTEEEVNEYGKDLLDVVGRRAREEVAPLLQERDQKIAQLTAQLQGVGAQQQMGAREKMHATLDGQLPNWRDVNLDPNFLTWLGLPDPFSGAIRHEMLKTAYAQNNAPRVAAFFNGYLAEQATVAPQAQPAPGTTTVPKVPLQNLAAPGRAKAPATTNPVSPEKPIISRADITQFYADCAAGRYRSKEPERAQMEREIFAAQREGRIA